MKQFHDLEKEIASTKGLEYASDQDRLQNFKIIADLINKAVPLHTQCPSCKRQIEFKITPLIVLAIYYMKHTLAFLDFIGRGNSLSESLKSRVLDIRVYSMLAYCLAREHEQDND